MEGEYILSMRDELSVGEYEIWSDYRPVLLSQALTFLAKQVSGLVCCPNSQHVHEVNSRS